MTDIKPPLSPDAPLLPPAELAEILQATASAKLLDRFGRPILLGCEIELHGELPPVYTIVDAKPDLRHNVPAGMWTLTVVSQIDVVCRQNTRHGKMTVVSMPPFAESGVAMPGTAPAGMAAAASDAPAASQGSIILTDMDKAARETLADSMQGTPTKTGPKLVPQPAAAAEGEPAAAPAETLRGHYPTGLIGEGD